MRGWTRPFASPRRSWGKRSNRRAGHLSGEPSGVSRRVSRLSNPAAYAARLAEDVRMTRKAKHCLLVVDDEADLVHSVHDLLRFDYRVLGATRAVDGLKIMEKEQVHIVMT